MKITVIGLFEPTDIKALGIEYHGIGRDGGIK